MCPVIQGIEAVPGQTLAGEEDSLLSQQDQGDSLLGEPSQSIPNGDLLGGELNCDINIQRVSVILARGLWAHKTRRRQRRASSTMLQWIRWSLKHIYLLIQKGK